jgi:hypothetical protein
MVLTINSDYFFKKYTVGVSVDDAVFSVRWVLTVEIKFDYSTVVGSRTEAACHINLKQTQVAGLIFTWVRPKSHVISGGETLLWGLHPAGGSRLLTGPPESTIYALLRAYIV